MRVEERRGQITGLLRGALLFVPMLLFLSGVPAEAGGRPEQSDTGSETSGQTSDDSSGFELEAGTVAGEGAEYDDPELPEQHQNQSPPSGAGRSFETDFSRAMVSFNQIISGGPPKDGIPAIDDPRFVSTEEANGWLEAQEPVLVFSSGTGPQEGAPEESAGRIQTHIYPLRILTYHEIVNDRVGDLPVTVTYCPLCNSGVAFHRVFDGKHLDFGTTGRLRYSNLIMYDRQTETWWQQATGRAIAGRYAGGRLKLLPTLLLSWENAMERYPNAEVLSRETGHNRPYGRNPYSGYDSSSSPFLYRGPEIDGSQEALSRVLTVYVEGEEHGFPYGRLREERVVMERVGAREVVVFWQPGTSSALDAGTVAGGRDVGTANAFFAEYDGEPLEFGYRDGAIVDTMTGSRWDVSGTALAGELAGVSLRPVNSVQHFWFSWRAFQQAASEGR